MTRLALAVSLALLAGCVYPAVTGGIQVRPEFRTDCAAHCDAMGMRLTAVVLIRNSAGCVCELRETSARAATSESVAAAAGAQVVVLEEEEQQRQQKMAEPHHGHPGPPPGAPGRH